MLIQFIGINLNYQILLPNVNSISIVQKDFSKLKPNFLKNICGKYNELWQALTDADTLLVMNI